jgi:hypothetical protein
MITFADDYSKFVFSKTLQHMAHAEGFNEHSKEGHRTFLSHATNFLMMCHQDVNLMISRADVSENGIAKEISFRWDSICTEGADKLIQDPEWYFLDLGKFKGGRPMVGALINHGTEDAPNWSSHT